MSATRSSSEVSTPGARGEVRLEQTPDGRPDVRVRTRAGEWIRLHSANAPESEARGMVDRALRGADVPAAVAVIGVGLGYAVDELIRRRPDVRIVALEPVPDLLPHWERRSDLSGLRASGQLVVGADPAYELPSTSWPASALEHDPPVIVHPALAHHWPERVERARRMLAQFMFERRANEEARQRLAPMYLEHTLHNLPALAGAADVSALAGIAAGEPLILCGAGPSLDRLLPELKAWRDRAWLVALDTAVRPLMAAGVVPDLIVSIDPTPLNGRHLLDLPLRERPWLVAETSLDPRAIEAFAARLIACRINRTDPWPWLESLGIAPARVKAWGSVLTSACDLVVGMKPSSVAFAGVDLAYTDGQTYCRGTAFEADWEEQRLHDGLPSIEAVWAARLRNNTIEEADIAGRPTQTSGHLVAFRNWVRALVAESPECRFANVTGAGILHGPDITQTTIAEWLGKGSRLGRKPADAITAVATPAWRTRADALATAIGTALEDAAAPWDEWRERVPGIERAGLGRVLELTRRRVRAHKGVDAMSVSGSEWIDVPFDASHFHALEPMQWQVRDQGGVSYSYRIDGKTMFLSFKINRSSLDGPPTRELFLRLPGNYLAARGTATSVWLANRIFKEMGYATVHPGQNRLVIHRANEEPFPNEDGYFYVFGQLFLEIQ